MSDDLAAILRLVSDDFETLEDIRRNGNEIRPDLNLDRERIEASLRTLVHDGFVSAFLLSSAGEPPLQINIHGKAMTELWFYATAAGRKVVEEALD